MGLSFERLALRGIDAAQAHHADVLRLHRRDERRVPALEAAAAGDIGHRDAVEVAALGGVERMEVGMGVEPEDEQLLALLARSTGDPGNRTGGKAVIAAEEHRHALCGGLVSGLLDGCGPGRDLAEVANGEIGMAPRLDRADRDRRTLDHRQAEVAERLGDARSAQSARAHVRAAPPRARLYRRRDENAGFQSRHVFGFLSRTTFAAHRMAPQNRRIISAKQSRWRPLLIRSALPQG